MQINLSPTGSLSPNGEILNCNKNVHIYTLTSIKLINNYSLNGIFRAKTATIDCSALRINTVEPCYMNVYQEVFYRVKKDSSVSIYFTPGVTYRRIF
jgi:hypothetical protein